MPNKNADSCPCDAPGRNAAVVVFDAFRVDNGKSVGEEVVVVVVAQEITGVNIERGLKASNEGQSPHHMGGAIGSFGVRPHIMMSYGIPSPLASYYPSLIPNR